MKNLVRVLNPDDTKQSDSDSSLKDSLTFRYTIIINNMTPILVFAVALLGTASAYLNDPPYVFKAESDT